MRKIVFLINKFVNYINKIRDIYFPKDLFKSINILLNLINVKYDHPTRYYRKIYMREYLSSSSNIHSFPNLISLYKANFRLDYSRVRIQ